MGFRAYIHQLLRFAPWGILGVLLVPLLPTSVFSSDAGGSTAQVSENEKEYHSCGQACLYEKGNENLLLQLQYINYKIQHLDQDIQSMSKTDLDKVLEDFCISTENKETCLERYKRVQTIVLLKMRNSMVQNSDIAARLRGSNQKPVPGAAPFPKSLPIQAEKDGSPKLSQLPSFSTYKDLQKQYEEEFAKESARMQTLIRQDLQNQYQLFTQDVVRKPNEGEFVQWERIPRDPNNPNGEMIEMVKRGPDGQALLDVEAYKRALDQYDRLVKDKQDKSTIVHTKAVPLKRPSPKMDSDPLNVRSYNAARGVLIETSNKAIGAATGNLGETKFPGNKPKPKASGNSDHKPAKTVLGPKPAGSPDPSHVARIEDQETKKVTEYTGEERVTAVPASKDAHEIHIGISPDTSLQQIDAVINEQSGNQ